MKLLLFRVLGTLIAICAVLLASKLTRAELDESQHSPVVQTESGEVVGKIEALPHGKTVHEYLGIPYAEPPVGELRFAAPKPAKPWSGIKRVTEYGASCPQNQLPLPGLPDRSEEDKEDCLFLNVFVPSTVKPDDKMAVMVWIHGGAFAYGSSTLYQSGVLATFNDVIVVSMNYRIGVLGFFNIPGTDFRGNYGMLDQVLAFKWVQANIASFGGDPEKVTIFGESAGGMSVSLHLVSPLSKGLFHRAIMQSGASSTPFFCGKITEPKQLELFAKLINCSLGPDLVECARGKTVEDITTAQSGIGYPNYTGSGEIVAPTVDGDFLSDLPEILFKTGEAHPDVDVITGFTSNEGALFAMMFPPDQVKDGITRDMFESFVKEKVPFARLDTRVKDLALIEYTDHADPDNKISIRQMMIDFFSDSGFVAPAILEAKALAKGGRPPYVYLFDHRAVHSPLPEWIGAVHGMDIPFVFGIPFKLISDPLLEMMVTGFSDIEKGMSLYVMKLWTDFAKHGSPTPPESDPAPVTWPKFTEEEQEYLVLDLKPRVGRRYKADKMAFWNEIVPKVAQLTQAEKKDTEKQTLKDEL